MATHWDVVIVGGGIAGLSAARILRKKSADVTIDDKARAKLYERAVWEGWDRTRVDEAFAL